MTEPNDRTDPPRCPKCGYSQEDADLHGDHYLCDGKIPADLDKLHEQVATDIRCNCASSGYRDGYPIQQQPVVPSAETLTAILRKHYGPLVERAEAAEATLARAMEALTVAFHEMEEARPNEHNPWCNGVHADNGTCEGEYLHSRVEDALRELLRDKTGTSALEERRRLRERCDNALTRVWNAEAERDSRLTVEEVIAVVRQLNLNAQQKWQKANENFEKLKFVSAYQRGRVDACDSIEAAILALRPKGV